MRRVNWKLWTPLMVAGAAVTLGLVSHLASSSGEPGLPQVRRPDTHDIRTIDGVRIRKSEPQPVVVPEQPGETQVASAAQTSVIRRAVQRAIIASARRDERTRVAAVTRLKKDRSLAQQIIQEEMIRARNPEHIRQLDMLSKEVGAR